jgi:hypothetical protein
MKAIEKNPLNIKIRLLGLGSWVLGLGVNTDLGLTVGCGLGARNVSWVLGQWKIDRACFP